MSVNAVRLGIKYEKLYRGQLPGSGEVYNLMALKSFNLCNQISSFFLFLFWKFEKSIVIRFQSERKTNNWIRAASLTSFTIVATYNFFLLYQKLKMGLKLPLENVSVIRDCSWNDKAFILSFPYLLWQPYFSCCYTWQTESRVIGKLFAQHKTKLQKNKIAIVYWNDSHPRHPSNETKNTHSWNSIEQTN